MIRMHGLVFLIAVVVSSTTASAPGSWSGNGPPGGDVYDLTADPLTSGQFYAATSAGVFSSSDGGLSWSRSSTGLSERIIQRIVHSPTQAGDLMAIGIGRIFFSSDSGANWADRTPNLPAGVAAVDVYPGNLLTGRYWMARDDNVIMRSNNSGSSWTATTSLPNTMRLSGIASAPNNADLAIASGIDTASNEVRVFRTTDAGLTWVEATCGGACPWVGLTVFISGGRPTFAGTAGEVYLGRWKSSDAGSNWTALPSGLGINVSVNPLDSTEVYGAVGTSGVCFTTDAGVTVDCDDDNFTANNDEIAVALSLVHDPFDPDVILAGTSGNGIYRRATAPPAGMPAVWGRSDAGLHAQLVRAVAVSQDGMTLLAARGGGFDPVQPLARSSDAGASWNYVSGPQASFLRAIAIDPFDSDIVYAAGIKIPARAIAGGKTQANGGIYKSSDGGINWNTIDSGIPVNVPFNTGFISAFGIARDIAFDTTSGLAGGGAVQTLYVGGTGLLKLAAGQTVVDAARIYKSTDAGMQWTPADNGIGDAEDVAGSTVYSGVVQLIHSPADATGQTLFAGTFLVGCCSQGGPLSTIDNGVFISTNGGASWSLRSNGLPRIDNDPSASHQNVLSLALDRSDATGNTLYASVNGSGNPLGTVYKTTDAGMNWSFAGNGLLARDVRDLIIDPATGYVYAAVADPSGSGDGGVFFSDDGGTSWSAVGPGFPAFGIALKLTLDGSGANPNLIAGSSHSALSLELVPDSDADSAANDIEDGAPNNGDGNGNGIPDSQESATASLLRLPFAEQALAEEVVLQGDQQYMTVSIDEAVEGSCAALERVESVANSGLASLPDLPGRTLPGGALRFRLADCDQATIEILYADTEFDASTDLRAFIADSSGAFSWLNVPVESFQNDSIRFTLQDGGGSDLTPQGDGIILFQGGPTSLAEIYFSDGFEPD